MLDAHLRRYGRIRSARPSTVEYWIPAEELDAFNDSIVELIEVVEGSKKRRFRRLIPQPVSTIDPDSWIRLASPDARTEPSRCPLAPPKTPVPAMIVSDRAA